MSEIKEDLVYENTIIVPQCKYHNICGRNVEGNLAEGLCISHSTDPTKDIDAFAKALAIHREQHGDNFTRFVFPKVDFSVTTFRGEADFTEAVFSQKANFNAAKFTKIALFNHATFGDDADFCEAVFDESPTFAFTTFAKNVTFFRAKFGNPICFFRKATFNGEANFAEATFGKSTVRQDATSSEEDIFDTFFQEATFSEKANFDRATFNGETHFDKATFNGETDFGGAMFGKRTFFDEAMFSGKANFRRVTFLEGASFAGRQGSTKVDYIFAGTEVDFTQVAIGSSDAVIFQKADLKRCRFLDTDLRKVQQVDVKWPRKGRRWVVYDEKMVTVQPADGSTHLWFQLERLYRELKQNHEDRRDYERGDFHYGEKEMRRKNPDTSWGLWLFLTLYWFFSGYGERFRRPLVWAGLLFAGSTFGYMWWGLRSKPNGSSLAWTNGWDQLGGSSLVWSNAWDWLQAAYYSFRVMTFLKPDDWIPVGYAHVINTFQTLLSPLFLGLFALALRQRLKR